MATDRQPLLSWSSSACCQWQLSEHGNGTWFDALSCTQKEIRAFIRMLIIEDSLQGSEMDSDSWAPCSWQHMKKNCFGILMQWDHQVCPLWAEETLMVMSEMEKTWHLSKYTQHMLQFVLDGPRVWGRNEQGLLVVFCLFFHFVLFYFCFFRLSLVWRL